ncbi:MAG: hypothetical protein EBU90_25150 [Proteobacteria bacterium]|nr:hypothetical protein [Pseudomonadota bacterium]
MPNYAIFDENNKFQNNIICDDGFELPNGWRKELVPEGHAWYGNKFVTYEELQSLLPKNIIPETI